MLILRAVLLLRTIALHRVALWAITLIVFVPVASRASGTISGSIVDRKTGEPLPYVNVTLKGTSLGSASDEQGQFTISGVPAGEYILVASVIGHASFELPGVVVGGTPLSIPPIALLDESVELGEVVVFGASRRRERLTEAPSAISVLQTNDIHVQAAAAQVPKLLESQPGVEIVQNGLFDFNINTRGFNSSLNRRLLVLLDGRDLAIAFLSAQEWNGLSVPPEDLGRIELVRGPSSSLYGANAFNGVINIQTAPPREITGTRAILGGGERSTLRLDLRHAGVSGPWGYKINAGHMQGDSWSVSRKNLTFEYDGFNILNNEVVDINPGNVASTYGSLRADYDIENDGTVTAEGGASQVENEIYITGIGRVQVPRAIKPWGRVSYSTESFFAQAWAAGRDSREPQLSLASGLPLIERSLVSQGEAQYRGQALDEHLFLIGGISFRYQGVNTDGTLMQQPRYDRSLGIYGQAEYALSPKLKFVGAARWDNSTLHSSHISPKIAAVWSLSASHSLRLSVNQAFQAPNLSELYLFVLRTAPNPYTGINSYFAYHGNPGLRVETITGYEAGYKGIINNTLFLSVDGYFNTLNDFITDLAPGVHPDFPEPVVLPGDTVLRAIWSYSNAGKVNEMGVELGVNYYLTDRWIVDANYTFFDFTVLSKGEKDILLPNAPKHKFNAGITYRDPSGLEIGAKVKIVPSFDWAAGIYQGRILAYSLINAFAMYSVSSRIQVTANVSNLLDREHYEIFGGSLLRRRAVGTVSLMF
jgi:iron complex outermembrane receptor protein